VSDSIRGTKVKHPDKHSEQLPWDWALKLLSNNCLFTKQVMGVKSAFVLTILCR
jgi:hypothetical protein